MGPNKFTFTLNKSKAAPDPSELTVPNGSSHADDDAPSKVSPKTEVTPPRVTDNAAYMPGTSFKGEKSDPESDPFLDTPSRTNRDRTAPSRWPPIEPPSSSREVNDHAKVSSSREPLQSRPSLSSSPRSKPKTNHTRAISAPPPPVSITTGKTTFDPQPGKLNSEINKALEDFGARRKLDVNHTVETTELQKPHVPGLWIYEKYKSRGEDVTPNQKREIIQGLWSSDSSPLPIQAASGGRSPASLVEPASDGEDPSKVQSAPWTPPLQRDQPNGAAHVPFEEATGSPSSSITPLRSKKLEHNNSTCKTCSMIRERNDPSVSSPVAITPLGTSPRPFLKYTPASHAQLQQSSAKDSETVKFDTVKTDAAKSDMVIPDPVESDTAKPVALKFELGSEIQTGHQKSSSYTASTSDNEKNTERRNMDQLQYSDSLEAESMLDRLLGLKYFEGAQSSLDQLSLVLHLLQQRDLRSSPKALLATREGTVHIQPSMLASTTDAGKPRSSKYTESAIAGSNVKIDKSVNKESGRPSSNAPESKHSSLLPVPSSSQGRSASESAIPTRGKIFRDVPGVPTDVDTNVRSTLSKKDGEIGVLIDFISPEGNVTLKKFTPMQLPKRYKGTTLQEHLQHDIQEPIKRIVQARRKHHGRIYIYWVQGNFGLVKIGFTTRTIDERLKEWRSQCKRTPHSIDLSRDYRDALPLVRRLEQLIHTELRDKRVREPVCSGCRKSHKEWFIVSNEVAKQVTQKWCDWMQQCPYEKVSERCIKSPKKYTPVKVEEKWTLKQEHVESLKVGKLRFKNGEESFRLSSLLESVPAPASAPPKLQSRRSQLAPSPRPRIRKSLSAGLLSGSPQNEEMNGSLQGRTTAAISSDLPAPPEGRYNFGNTPEGQRRRRSASQLT